MKKCHFPHAVPVNDVYMEAIPEGCVVDPFLACSENHWFCRFHLDVFLHLDSVNDMELAQTVLRRGCPVCRQVCPCRSCCKHRKEISYLPGDKVGDMRQLVFAYHVPQKTLEFSKFHVPMRITVDQFTDALFEDAVIRKGIPVIVTGFDKVLDCSGLWDLPKQLNRDGPCKRGALCQVRVQGITDRNMADFVVLDELSDMDPRVFFSQMIGGCSKARNPLSKEFRNASAGRCVWYCKDWMFGEWEPKWIEDLQRALPSRLRPRNPFDLLGGLEGDAKVDVMMAYLGVGGTRTPLHLDKAASNAYNCVVWSETPESCKRWWIFHRDDCDTLNAYIRASTHSDSFLQEDVHWIDPAEFEGIQGMKHPAYSFEQALGELVIVPHNSPHCVINQGGMTFACAANIIDATVAQESFEQALSNKKLRIKTVYKVAGAVWGVMNKCDLPSNVMTQLIELCRRILGLEKVGIERLESFASPARDKGLNYIFQVLCDCCQGDVFNSYVLVGTQGKTFCPDPECLAEAVVESQYYGKAPVKIIPRTLKELTMELERAEAKLKKRRK